MNFVVLCWECVSLSLSGFVALLLTFVAGSTSLKVGGDCSNFCLLFSSSLNFCAEMLAIVISKPMLARVMMSWASFEAIY